jgi:nucleoid-associated protein YgaU
MKKFNAIPLITIAILSLATAGCAVRHYSITKDRVDQDLITKGNRGYLAGQPAQREEPQRKSTRTVHILEVEVGSPEKVKKTTASEPLFQREESVSEESYARQPIIPVTNEAVVEMEKYKVAKGETLQKISKKFYGTTKKWAKIYEANKDILKAPDKLYPGQVINIPVESGNKLKEPAQNLK